MDKPDKHIIHELKKAILQSRYQAAKLVNRELISLYFYIGNLISVNAGKQSWGSKVLEQISGALQKELPGLKGFSAANLKKMRVFADFWIKEFKIGSTSSNQITKDVSEIGSTLSI